MANARAVAAKGFLTVSRVQLRPVEPGLSGAALAPATEPRGGSPPPGRWYYGLVPFLGFPARQLRQSGPQQCDRLLLHAAGIR